MSLTNRCFMNVLAALLMVGSVAAISAESAGNIIRANGVVNAVDASGKSRPLAAGDAINVGDVITSSLKSSVQIQMKDTAIIAMSANSAFKVDGYRFQEKAGASEPDKVDLTVQQGRLRTITGRAAKSGYTMSTNGVVVKVAGTIYDILNMPDGSIVIILREGAITVTSGGVTQRLDVPGTMVKISAKGKPPSKPMPATESTDDLDAVLPLTKSGPTGGPDSGDPDQPEITPAPDASL